MHNSKRELKVKLKLGDSSNVFDFDDKLEETMIGLS